MMAINIGGMRKPYADGNTLFLEENLVAKEPIAQFSAWFKEACDTPEVIEPNAMCLATASRSGVPSARMILLKSYGPDGFKFFTNYGSRKGQELEENPRACLCFYWAPLKRTVRIEGVVKKVSKEESEEYFHSRPRPSQIGALVSNQNGVVASRHVLDERDDELKRKYSSEAAVIPKPELWGGYCVVPSIIEFWQGQSNRIHDRIVFRRQIDGEKIHADATHAGDDGWVYERLEP